MLEENFDDIMNNKEDIDSKIIKALDGARKIDNVKDMKIPEEVALSFDMTYKELKEKIDSSDNEKLKRSWTLYRETLKVKYSKNDKETAKDMQANYQLGIESKSFPAINFYFGNDVKEYQAINVILEQTKLQREKNAKEAEAMGNKVMSDQERRELNEVLGEFDE